MSDRNLRSGLIRLAYANPNLRHHLLPLIEKEAAGKAKVPSMGEVNSAVEGVLKAIRSKYRGTLRLADPKKYTDEATKKAEEALLDAFSGTDATQDDLDKAWKQALKKIEAELDDEVSGLEEEAGEDESVASMLEEWQDFLGDFRKAVTAGKHKAPKMKTAALPLPTGKQAGTLRYEGDTALDKVYAMTDLLGEVKRALPPGMGRAPEVQSVQKALYALEDFAKKSAPAQKRAATGVPDYADLTKRLLFLLNSMTSPPHAKMVEGVMQVLQAWATANGLDVRHNLKEIAEDLLYDATALGKPSVNAYKVEKVMQGQYPTAFTSRRAADTGEGLTKQQAEVVNTMRRGVELWSTAIRGKETFALTNDPYGKGKNVRAPLAYELMSMKLVEADPSPGSAQREHFHGQGTMTVRRYRLTGGAA